MNVDMTGESKTGSEAGESEDRDTDKCLKRTLK